MANKESNIIYQKHVEICEQFLSEEQFGKVMYALFKLDQGKETEFGDDIVAAVVFAFMSLQKDLDDEKYAKRCETNRKNAMKGGAPKGNQNARKQPKQPNAEKNNPNDNENENENGNENDDENEKIQHLSSFGLFDTVELTEGERTSLKDMYENSNKLIDKVSVWIRDAKYEVPDHYGLCIKFANNENWPKRKVIEPVSLPEVTDPLTPEEQAEMTARMRSVIGGMKA